MNIITICRGNVLQTTSEMLIEITRKERIQPDHYSGYIHWSLRGSYHEKGRTMRKLQKCFILLIIFIASFVLSGYPKK